MTQHTDLIERLRSAAWAGPVPCPVCDEAADAMEATAKSAFESMPHDIPQRMKDAICEETGWSGSMVSRMYTELRKAFTGEPYKGNEDLDAALTEIGRRECLFWEACKPHGKVGEVVYMTYKTKRDAKGQP